MTFLLGFFLHFFFHQNVNFEWEVVPLKPVCQAQEHEQLPEDERKKTGEIHVWKTSEASGKETFLNVSFQFRRPFLRP